MLVIQERGPFIRFDWGCGHVEILKTKWDKLPQKKKNLVYMKSKENNDGASKNYMGM